MSRRHPIATDEPEHAAPIVASGKERQGAMALHHRPVTHSYAALVYCRSGRVRMELRGEWTVSEGDVFLVPAGQPHRAIERQALVSWEVGFHVPALAPGFTERLLSPFERVRAGASPVLAIDPKRRTYFEGLLRELAESQVNGGDVLPVVQRSLLTLILAEVDRAASVGGQCAASESAIVVESLRFIERNCLRPLTLNEVAAVVHRSPTHVTSVVSQATGKSVVQWIVSGRMAEARRLLLHSDEMVDVIAERVGYADATHFIRMFRREHGATPAAWRAAQARTLRLGGTGEHGEQHGEQLGEQCGLRGPSLQAGVSAQRAGRATPRSSGRQSTRVPRR